MKNFSKESDIPHLLRHRYIADDFDKERVKEMTKLIADPKNSLIFLASKKFDDKDLPINEEWYNINYSSDKFDEDLLAQIKKPVKDNGKILDLPEPNTLLPTNFDILPK